MNKRTVQIVKNGQTESINAEMIRVGDIIYLKNEENVPCDAVVLATSYQVTFLKWQPCHSSAEGFGFCQNYHTIEM